MQKYFNKFLIPLLLLTLCSAATAQWNLKTNTEDGKYSGVVNSAAFFGVSAGKILTESVFVLSQEDTTSWRLVSNTNDGLYSIVENKASFMGVDSGKVRTKAVYILNPQTLTSLGLDTSRLAYLNKSNSFIGRKQTFDTLNATAKYLLNGVDINTAGTLSNVAYLNQNAVVSGRYTVNDLINFQDSIQLGSAHFFFANGKVNSTKSFSADTLFAGIMSAVSYSLGPNRIIFTTSNNLNMQSSAGRDLLLGTGSAGSIFTFQSGLGNIVYTPGAVSGSATTPAIDISQTWNTTGTPTAFKMNITNTASNSSSLLMDLQTSGSSIFNVTVGGNGYFAGALRLGQILTHSSTGGSSTMTLTQRLLNFSFYNTTDVSGTVNSITANPQILPTSGTAIFNAFLLTPTINQTGGANGITRGLYINPALTNAFDWRAIEVKSGKSLFQDVVVENDLKGLVLKDSSGHYWRISVSTGGTLSTIDLGTSLTGF